MAASHTEVIAGRKADEARRGWGVRADAILRGLAGAGLLWATISTGWGAASEWFAQQQTEESVRKAMRMDPGNAAHIAAYARLKVNSTRGAAMGEVAELWEKAVALNPRRAEWWAELGGAYEWSGRIEEAQRAFEKAQELFPRSPEMNWRLGNFYLRAGRHAEAQRTLRRVVADEPERSRGVFDLAWRAGYGEKEILEAVVPDESSARMTYLNYLVETRRTQAAKKVWAKLLAGGMRVPAEAAFPYLDALIQDGEAEELRQAWRATAGVTGETGFAANETENEITNGSFERPILNGGRDWRVLSADGVVSSLDTSESFEGRSALRVEFNGKSNPAYSHVLQFVPVEPNRSYRMGAYLRAQGITSNSGPRVEIYDHGNRERLFVATEDVRGTTGWVSRMVEFRTGEATRILVVRLARPASTSLDGRIGGTVWVDHVVLRAVN